jgi:hypothetical protein
MHFSAPTERTSGPVQMPRLSPQPALSVKSASLLMACDSQGSSEPDSAMALSELTLTVLDSVDLHERMAPNLGGISTSSAQVVGTSGSENDQVCMLEFDVLGCVCLFPQHLFTVVPLCNMC